jgi:signal transduction histidine kinase
MTPQLIGRLTAPVAVLSAMLLVTAIGAAWYVRDMQQRLSGPITESVASMTAAQELEISLRDLSSHFNRYLITHDRTYLDPVPRLKQRVDSALADADAAASSPAEQALIRRIRRGYERFNEKYAEMIRNAPREGVYTVISTEIDPILAKEILEPAHNYLLLNEAKLTRDSETNQQLADRLTVGLVALGLCGSIGGLLGGAVIAVAIRRSLLQAEQRLLLTVDQLDQAVKSEVAAETNDKPTSAVERMAVSASAVLQRLRRSERDALRAEQLAWVGQMAAGLAHEIRNPLMAIKVLVQAAAERRVGPGFHPQDLKVLEEEIVRLEQIVCGFLDFARPPRPEIRPVDIRDLAERTVDGVKARAELQGVEIRVVPPTGPTVVSADPNQLRQVLFNLMFNALDAQPQGGHITVRFGILPAAADGFPALVLSVEDNGPGLPEQLGDRIFEPFVSTKESGLGLGLSICRRIAESHAGSLTAEMLVAGGSAFVLRLPVIPPSKNARDLSESSPGGHRA